jgi:hypothetical protein
MSILDVDRGHAERLNPMPNVGDKVFQQMAHGIVSVNYKTPLTDDTTQQQLQTGFGQLVQQNTIEIVNDGSALTTNANAHGLGYVPIAVASIPAANVTSAFGTITGASLFLPQAPDISVSGGIVQFKSWLYHYVDNEAIYFNLVNGTGSPRTIFVTYYLYRQRAI